MSDHSAPASAGEAPSPDAAAALATCVRSACERVAPLWPLHAFVAVNPFHGFTDHRFARACARLESVCGRRLLMPRSFYRARLADGTIGDADLEAALAQFGEAEGLPRDATSLRGRLSASADVRQPATVAAVVDRLNGFGRRELAIEEVSKWCSAYWDAGQATWRMPWRDAAPFAAWRAAASHDRTAAVMGVRPLRALAMELPDEPLAAIARMVEELQVRAVALEDYLLALLADVGGWAAWARYQGWGATLRGGSDDTVVHVLAMRLAWDVALFRQHGDARLRTEWSATLAFLAAAGERALPGGERRVDWLVHEAWEHAYQRRLVGRLARAGEAAAGAASFQAVFCIDVRSEVYRRALERADPACETLGFAGFFGVPMAYRPLGHESADAHCPVLLEPKYTVSESVGGASPAEARAALGRRRLRRRFARAWKAFRGSAVSSFVYVETLGLGYAGRLLGNSLGLTRPVTHPGTAHLPRRIAARLRPAVAAAPDGTGLDLAQRIDTAESILRGMSLVEGFAPVVLLVGHGSTSTNNPHAHGLDCGACGGRSGAPSARVAAAILNEPAVRAGLAQRGIEVGDDTCFVPALHDTTSDAVTLLDRERVPPTHAAAVERIERTLAAATAHARAERAPALGVAPERADSALPARGRDWSQVRPEWGLAGNAAFVAARRAVTRGIDLGGRAFLHTYDPATDPDGAILESVMTAPMVVAAWINLQYFGSTVDNAAFGSGNKALHNVVGTIGVLEGNGGDLRPGLPLQSLHDGRRWVHEPLRLNVILEASPAAIDAVVARHDTVRDLVEHGWVHLFAIDGRSGHCRRYAGAGRWTPAGSTKMAREDLAGTARASA